MHEYITMRRQLRSLESEKAKPHTRRVCQQLGGFGILGLSLHAPESYLPIFNLTPHFQLNRK